MPFVLTVDQRGSRRGPDLVDITIEEVTAMVDRPMLAFERTAGDEFQGVVATASEAITVALRLVRHGRWSVGIGVGPVEAGASSRASRGQAFLRARAAVDQAKRRPHHVAVIGPGMDDDDDDERSTPAGQADAVITMLAAVVGRRTEPGWEAVDLVESGSSLAETAAKLGVSRQAVGQRLSVALWREEIDVRRVATSLLSRSEAPNEEDE
jgi:hypothetical protein